MYMYLLRREENSIWWACLQPTPQQREQDSMGGKCSPAALADLVTPWGVLPRLLLSRREATVDAHSLAIGRVLCGSGPTMLGIAPHETSWLSSKTPELLKPLQQSHLHHFCQCTAQRLLGFVCQERRWLVPSWIQREEWAESVVCAQDLHP